jgi:ribonucleoside-diphosphate reductase alpha chain
MRPEDVEVFTCSMKQWQASKRVSATAQLRMMAAIQPFLSGGIAHTVTLDHNASLEVVHELIFEA